RAVVSGAERVESDVPSGWWPVAGVITADCRLPTAYRRLTHESTRRSPGERALRPLVVLHDRGRDERGGRGVCIVRRDGLGGGLAGRTRPQDPADARLADQPLRRLVWPGVRGGLAPQRIAGCPGRR